VELLMPSKSGKQHRLMALVANDPKAAKRLGIPQSVGRDYVEADKGRKFGDDNMKSRKFGESKAMMRKEVAFMKKKGAPKSMIRHEEKEMGMKKGIKKMAGGAAIPGTRALTPREREDMRLSRLERLGSKTLQNPVKPGLRGGKLGAALTGAGMLGAAAKGLYDQFMMPEDNAQMSPMPETLPVGNRKGGKITSRMKAPKKHRYAGGGVTYSGGGSVYRSKADGIASKGKTKGKIVKMRYGGEC
jgi:hypothetical protein